MPKRYKCPYCGVSKERKDLVRHIEDKHEDMIPEGFTPMRVAFNAINYPNNMDYNGKCTECGGPTRWDEDKGRYDRQCGKKACHDSFVKNFETNMMNKTGVTRITQTVEGQEKMLANRSISGRYKFSDGTIKTYTGNYERQALEFMDKVLNCKSIDIACPGPSMEYEFNGQTHWYISDIYYIPYNLIIEVKDGGDRPNNRNMPEYRAKQIAKEDHIIKHTDYNYLRLTDNDFSQLLATMSDLKLQLVEKSGERVININENMFAGMQSMMPMAHSDDVYVINYRKNNVFSGDDDFAVSDSPTFDSIFYRDGEGKLRKGDRSLLEDTVYDLYKVRGVKARFESAIKDHIDTFVDNKFIYESVFDKKLYTNDQIKFEPMAESAVDMYRMIDELSKITKQYTSRNYGRAITESVDGSKIDLLTGTKYDESKVPNLLIEQNNDVQMYLSLLIENYIGTRPVHENSITIQNYKCEECGKTSKEVEVRFPKDPDYDRVKRLHPDWNLSKGNLGYAICPNCKTKNDILVSTESSVLTEDAINGKCLEKDGTFYFYHLLPKGADISKGIVSLDYQYHHDINEFRKNSDKYRDRLCNGWNIYPGRDPESLSDKEVYDGINTFRKSDQGCNQIYLFKYPPYKELGNQMSKILSSKDIYRIDINKLSNDGMIINIDFGNEQANIDKARLSEDWYRKISHDDYFKDYRENDPNRLLFSYMNHISVMPKDGRIPKKYITKISAKDARSIMESSVLTESVKDWVYHEQPIEDVTDDHIQKAYDYARHICEWCSMDSFAFVNINFCKAPIKLSNTSFVFGYLRDGCDQRTIDEIINTLNRNNSFNGGHYAAELQERDGRQAIILTITKLFYFEKIEDKGGE